MSFSIPTGPVGTIGIALSLAYLLRLNVAVTVLCAILPDLVDKPLTAVLWISEGRYIAHTLLFVFLVAMVFLLWKRPYGLAALVGGITHLLLDLGGLTPWFYPFVSYDFTYGSPHIAEYFQNYLAWSGLGMEVTVIALAGLSAFLLRWFYRWHSRRR